MKVRKLRKVHQHSMFPVRWPHRFNLLCGTSVIGTVRRVLNIHEDAMVIDNIDAYLTK